MTDAPDLRRFPVHLGLGAAATPQPEFTGMEWYEGYAARTAADGAEGRLVSLYDFSESWDSWEMHPQGDELVVCTAGSLTLVQKLDGGRLRKVELTAGAYAINPAGVWHTVDILAPASALFITAGIGTMHEPR